MEERIELERPIRVVVFGGGPVLERGAKEFLCRLEVHPEIDLLACFCQSGDQSFRAVLRDLWQRRGFLAIPLVVLHLLKQASTATLQMESSRRLNNILAQLKPKIHYIPDIHAQEVLCQVCSLQPDLGLVYSSPILKPELFQIPVFGTLGIHHGKVPEYRGKKTTFWAVFNGEKTAGVTIQKINAGLDTGQVAKAGEVKIDRKSLRRVSRELEKLGFDLYLQAILEVKRGTVQFRPQVGTKGKLYRDPKLYDVLLQGWKQLFRMLGA